jgi:hypothetical protein
MRRRFLAIALTLLVTSGAPTAVRADGGLILNEILAGPARDWDGSGAFSSRDDEWVEVVNTGATPLDLVGFLITDGDSIPRFALSGSLDAGAHLLVTGKQSFDWEHATGFPAFGLSLGNSGDAVILWQVTGPDTVVVDAYTYKSHEAAADRAVGRDPDGSGVWTLFDGLNPYTGTLTPSGTGCMPSPGATNVCASTPVRVTTWGRVKTLYR